MPESLFNFTGIRSHSRTDIARFLKVSRTSVNKWVSNFLLHGVAGLDSVR
ncbi:helix-turn-helix domain-containing protein, partial [Aeromonas caviae]